MTKISELERQLNEAQDRLDLAMKALGNVDNRQVGEGGCSDTWDLAILFQSWLNSQQDE